MEETVVEKSAFNLLSGFILKVIAIISMTFDHVGQVVMSMYPYGSSIVVDNIYISFKIIGRLALPLFCFLIVEGMIHTKDKKKYLFRLGIEALIISIVLLIIYYLGITKVTGIDGLLYLSSVGNIFLDLFLGALIIYLFMSKNKAVRFIPIIILLYSIICFGVRAYEYQAKAIVYWLPHYLRMQYDWFSISLIAGFYACNYIPKLYFNYQSSYSGIDSSTWENTEQWQLVRKIAIFGVLIFISLIYYIFGYFNKQYEFYDGSLQQFCILSGLLILLYNGKRGYNNKWFQYGCYIYYPLHIAIIIIIFGLIWML